MNAHDGEPELEVLSQAECWQLVRSQGVGRFASNQPRRGPHVVPVNYVVHDDLLIVFRTGAGMKLQSLRHGLVTIQVDEIDRVHHTGWSVIVEGSARWLYEEQEPTAIEQWAPGDRPYVVRVQPTRVTGRRIRLHQPDTDPRGYR